MYAYKVYIKLDQRAYTNFREVLTAGKWKRKWDGRRVFQLYLKHFIYLKYQIEILIKC